MTTTTIDPELTEAEELAIENRRLAEAQQAIAEIQARRAERQRVFDIQTLETVRAELAKAQSLYQTNLPIFRAQEQDYDNARSHILTARGLVADSQRHMPAVAEYLPEDAEVRRWKKHHDQLEARLADAQTTFDSLPNPEILRLELVGVGEKIAALGYSDANLTRKLLGERSTWADGGVSDVGSRNSPNGKSWIR